jgi:hypothetical protein
MRTLDESLALDLIERGARLLPLDRAVLLTWVLGEIEPSMAADLPLDRRDRYLLDARIATFGPHVELFARCTHCGEAHDADFDLTQLPGAVEAPVEIIVAGRLVRLRAPSSRALADVALSGVPTALVDACVEDASAAGADVVAAIESALVRSFPLLDIRLELECSACARNFGVRFDIVAWLWRELEEMAVRAIDTVDRLARVYGWSEREILGLSATRRALYLAKVGA